MRVQRGDTIRAGWFQAGAWRTVEGVVTHVSLTRLLWVQPRNGVAGFILPECVLARIEQPCG